MAFEKADIAEYKKKSEKAEYIYCRIFWWIRRLIIPMGLFVSSVCAAAQGTPTERPVLISAVFDRGQDGESPELDSIFLDSLEIELERAGFKISKSTHPAILIHIAYSASETFIQISLSAVAIEDGHIIYEHSSSEELSFEFDKVLLGYAGQLASNIRKFVEEKATGISGEVSIGSTAGMPVAPVVKTPMGSTLKTVRAEPGFPILPSRFVMDADVGLFLAAGEPGRYVKGGYSLSAMMGYRIPYNSGFIVGLSVEGMYFMLDGYSAEASGFAVISGPGFWLRAHDSNVFVPGLKMNAGAALLMVFQENSSPMSKFIPAAEGAMTVSILLEKITIQVLMGVKVFYEGSSILYGFAPGIGIEF